MDHETHLSTIQECLRPQCGYARPHASIFTQPPVSALRYHRHLARTMADSSASPPSPEFLAETNDPYLDQRVSIAFIVIDTAFLLLFYTSRYYNAKAIGTPMLVCNTICYIFCLGSAVAGICGFFPLFLSSTLFVCVASLEREM